MMDLQSLAPAMDKCSHCAFCQAACPVFRADLLETHAPRARMQVIRSVLVEKTRPRTRRMEDIVSRCLMCGACSRICPASVPVADVVALARNALYGGSKGNAMERAFLMSFMRHRGVTLMWNMALRPAKLVGLAPKELPLPSAFPVSRRFSGTLDPEGKPRARVAYFVGCSPNSVYQDTAEAAIQVLLKNGISVVFPENAVCCGMPALARGDVDTAKEMMAANLAALSGLEVDAVVTDCTTCGTMFVEKALWLFSGEEEILQTAQKISKKTFEVMDYLQKTGLVVQPSRLEETFTYHVPCHHGWSKTLADAPRNLLSQVPGLVLKEMENPESCCGSGGAFFREHPALAANIRKAKHADILATGVKTVATQCPACRAYLSCQPDYGVVHPVSLLARAYDKE